MPRLVMVIFAVSLLAACAPQAIMSDNRQALIGAWSKSEAVARAEQECGEYGRWPSLRRQGLNTYWFDCNETADPVTTRWGFLVAATPLSAVSRSDPPKANPATTSGQGNWVQLGAFRERTAAEKYLVDVRTNFPGVVTGHTLVLREADLGPKGRLVLARLGPYVNMKDAQGTCGLLKQRGTACFIVARH